MAGLITNHGTVDGDRTRLRVLRAILELRTETGFPPTVREIGDRAGLSSLKSVHNHLVVLEANKFITRRPNTQRSIQLTRAGRRVLRNLEDVEL